MANVYYKKTVASFPLALKTARTALGWSQSDLANLAKLSKTTIARFETFEGGMRLDNFKMILRLFKEHGVSVRFSDGDVFTVDVSMMAVESVLNRSNDESNRRSDRKKKRVKNV